MFTYLKLKNYKSLINFEVDLTESRNTPKKLVSIYGENGVGKSNFVDSFYTLKKFTNSKITNKNFESLANERDLTEKNIYYVDGKEIVLWLPEGVIMDKFSQTFKDKRTGYGLPFSINYKRECPDQIITNVAKEYDGLKVVSDSKDYIYIYSFYSEERFKNAKEILIKIKEKNGFTHRCKNGKFD